MSLIEFLEAHWPELTAAAAALASIVTTVVNLGKTKHLEKALAAAKRRQTSIVCPHCHKESPLSEVNFKLPSGELDNNLNGVPDNSEL